MNDAIDHGQLRAVEARSKWKSQQKAGQLAAPIFRCIPPRSCRSLASRGSRHDAAHGQSAISLAICSSVGPCGACSVTSAVDLRQSIRESDDLLFLNSVVRSVGNPRRAMPTRTLCPQCHGQRTTYCRVCRGTGKKSIAGISVGNCNTCGGTGRRRCDVCGGSGEVEPPNEKKTASTDHRAL